MFWFVQHILVLFSELFYNICPGIYFR